MSEDSNTFDRRNVLRMVGTAALAGVGVGAASGGATAVTARGRLELTYSDEDSLRAALAEHASGVVATLREEGFVGADFDLEALDLQLDPTVGGLSPTAADGRAGVTAITLDGTSTALGMVSTSSDTHEVSLYVQPERDEAYAFVEPTDGGQRLIATTEDVEPQNCVYDSCEDCCGVNYRTKLTWYCNFHCQDCYVYDTDCGCRDCVCHCWDGDCYEGPELC